MKSSGIGGQAVMEGVMMKNGSSYAVSVRTPDGQIDTMTDEFHSIGEKHAFFRVPIVRGVVAFIESLTIGMKTLTYSASFYDEEEEEEESKLEKKLTEKFGSKGESIVMAGTVALSLILAIAIFMMLPFFLSSLLGNVIKSQTLLIIIEGLIRVAIFILYVVLISKMEEIHRVFMYHGAEHKSINCVEHGLPLTVENARKQSREHKRCGTSFLLYVMLISIILFMFIRVESPWLRILYRLLLIPVIAGVSYELIRLAGRSDNVVVRVISKPGLWLQGLTTKEPTDDMLEVAIASVNAVFDWESFIKDVQTEEKAAAHKEQREKRRHERDDEDRRRMEMTWAEIREEEARHQSAAAAEDSEEAEETFAASVVRQETAAFVPVAEPEAEAAETPAVVSFDEDEDDIESILAEYSSRGDR